MAQASDSNSKPNSTITRCAIYARCAAGNPATTAVAIAEQVRECIEYTENQGWKVISEFVQADIGASGVALTTRPSLLHLLEAVMKKPRPFDSVLVSDISRLGRDLTRVTTLTAWFHACGVFVQTVRGPFDTRKILFKASPVKKLSQLSHPVFGAIGRAMSRVRP